MATLLTTDPIVFARDENNNIIIPLRIATGLEAILILVRTAWLLWRDEWFLDRSVGTPWLETEDGTVTEADALLGQHYDAGKTARALRGEALKVTGVRDVVEFKSSFDNEARELGVSAVIRTVFGDAPLTIGVPA